MLIFSSFNAMFVVLYWSVNKSEYIFLNIFWLNLGCSMLSCGLIYRLCTFSQWKSACKWWKAYIFFDFFYHLSSDSWFKCSNGKKGPWYKMCPIWPKKLNTVWIQIHQLKAVMNCFLIYWLIHTKKIQYGFALKKTWSIYMS